jgi:tetratricopeptide (TPR) repeat protein
LHAAAKPKSASPKRLNAAHNVPHFSWLFKVILVMPFSFRRLCIKAILCVILPVFSQMSHAKTLELDLAIPQPEGETAYLLPISDALNSGDIIRAESLLRTRLDEAPEDAIAWEVLGVTLALGGDVSGADAAYANSVEIDPARLSAWVKRGDLAEAAGNITEAMIYWTSAIEVAPTYSPANQRLGEAYADANDLTRAIEHLEVAVSTEEAADIGTRVELAFVYNRAGRPEDTLALFADRDVATETDAGVETRLMLVLGNAYAQSGDTANALSLYQRGIDVAPEDNTLLRAKGALLVETGDAAGAIELLSKPAAAEPVDAYANLQYARALSTLGRSAEAIDAAERAVTASGAADISRQALSIMARANLMKGDFPAATDATARLVTLLPDDPASWREHAAIHGATGQYEATRAIYDEAISRFEGDAELLRGRSIVNVRLGQLEAAAEDAASAANAAPGWLEPQFLLGEIELARNLNDNAEDAFRAALAINSDHWPSLVHVASLRLVAGDTDEALQLAQQAVELSGGAAIATEILTKVQAQ